MKILYCLLLMLLFSSGYAQEDKSNDYTIRYNKLKELYLKQLNSKSHVELQSLLYNFFVKVQADIQDVKTIDDYLPWVKANLNKTAFKSFAEAEKEWKKIETARENETVENKEYHDYVLDCLIATKSSEILINSQEDVKAEHPELFPKPVCPAIKS